jgi:fatty acid desaturase
MRYRADLRSLLFVAVYFGLVIVQWYLAPGSWWLAVPLFAATCLFSFFGAVITHNTVHSPVFHSRTANRVLQVVLSLTYGSPVSSYVPGHNLSHHKHTQTARDVMRTTKVRSNWNLLNMFVFVPVVALAIMKNDAAYTKHMQGHHKAWYRQLRIEQVVVFGLTIALFVLDWKKALLYWQIPHLYAAWGIIGINYLQHDGCDVTHAYNHSRSFVGKAVNWWTFNNGYHGIHHLTPGLHWSLLPAAHDAKLAPFLDPRLAQDNFPAYLFRTFVYPGKRETFDGKPVVLPPPSADTNWLPRPEETPEDLGAVTVEYPFQVQESYGSGQ